MVNKPGCVELGLTCTDAYKTLAMGVGGSQANQLSPAALETINHLTT